jgi:hypothetical protein
MAEDVGEKERKEAAKQLIRERTVEGSRCKWSRPQ